jgi:hypothetical protein
MSRRGLATRWPTVVAVADRPPSRPLTRGGPLPPDPGVAVHQATPDARTRASGPARSNRRASDRQRSCVPESPPEPGRKLAGLPFVTAVLAHSVRCVEADRASAQDELVAASSLLELMCWWPVDDRHGVLGAAGRAGRAFHATFVARCIASLTSAAARQTRRSNSLPHVQRDTARAGALCQTDAWASPGQRPALSCSCAKKAAASAGAAGGWIHAPVTTFRRPPSGMPPDEAETARGWTGS